MKCSNIDLISISPVLDIKKDIRLLMNETEILKDLRSIRNELISNGAYHEKNLEEQMKKIENLHVPEDEKALIIDSNMLSFELSHLLMEKYKILLDKIRKKYGLLLVEQ